MAYSYLIQGKNIVVVVDNTPYTIGTTHIAYEKVKEAIKNGQWDVVKEVVDPTKIVLNYGNGNISVQGDKFFWKGEEMANALTAKIIDMFQQGFPIQPMVAFMENLMLNPSKRAVTELYRFLEKGNLPITEDGHFLAYKKVRKDFKDCHTGTLDNSVGKVLEMERNKVDDDQNRTCSSGLHFCSMSYLSQFGGERTMILKINPRDVVSIPTDYNDSKGRTCRYEVVGELGVKPEEAFTAAVQENANAGVVNDAPGYTDVPQV